MSVIKKIIFDLLPFNREYLKISKTKLHISYLSFFKHKLGFLKTYWPKSNYCTVANASKIFIGINSLVGRPGVYLQGEGNLYIGNYVQLGPNVGVLSSNHALYDQRKSISEKVVIGDYCWIGMNSVVLPGVKLGTRTIVGAGSVVTKSFEGGYCVIAGNPARKIKNLHKELFKPWQEDIESYGFVLKERFEEKNKDIVTQLRNEINNI